MESPANNGKVKVLAINNDRNVKGCPETRSMQDKNTNLAFDLSTVAELLDRECTFQVYLSRAPSLLAFQKPDHRFFRNGLLSR